MSVAQQLIDGIQSGRHQSLARALTLVENELGCWQEVLLNLPPSKKCKIIGITGPPGAGKSTLVNSLTNYFIIAGKRIAILAIDPTSPFNLGSLLGDRVRMSNHFTNKDVFIRSLATRGSLGGLSAKTIEMCDVLRSAPFDYIFIETVGVGQSEIEIAGLADISVVVLVPESGDEIQFLKSGLMEIANIFVVNKADREGAGAFAAKLQSMLHQTGNSIPIFKTKAETGDGVEELAEQIANSETSLTDRKLHLLAEKAYRLISEKRMANIKASDLKKEIHECSSQGSFNLYQYVNNKVKNS